LKKGSFLSSPDNPQPDPAALPSEPQLSAADYLHVSAAHAADAPAPKAGENPVWSGWDVLVIAILTLGILFVVQLVTVLAARQFAYPHRSWIEVAQKPVLALLAELVAYIAVALYMFLLVEGKYHARFWQAIRWNWPGVAGLSIFAVGVLMLGFDALGRFLPMPKTTPFDQFFERPMDAYLTVAFAVTLGPLMEELFFRGFLYPVMARRMGAVWGIILTALPFRPDALRAISFLVGRADHYYGRRGAHHGPRRDQVCGLELSGARRLQRNSHGAGRMVATDGFRHMEKAGIVLF
jgi:membrane protease YdiL (CAAX protease family)